MKKSIMLIVFLILINGLYGETKKNNWEHAYFALDLGAGSSDILVDGMSFGIFLEPKFSFSSRIMVGSKNAIHFSTDNLIAYETQFFFRYNILRLGSRQNTTNIFAQVGAGLFGAFRKYEDQYDGKYDIRNSRASPLADLTVGINIPIGSRWHIEPSFRGGYPFRFGASLTFGHRIPLPQRTVREVVKDYEYVEIIRNLPVDEIVRRVLVNQVEHILFAPNISVFNQDIDYDARALNDMVLNNTAQLLRGSEDLRVRIEGHANPVTNDPSEYNDLLALGKNRADEIARLLMIRGVSEEKIVIADHSGERAIASSRDYDRSNMNRLVELLIIQIDAN